MNIRLPFFAFFLAVSFIMNAQNNSAQVQIKNEISDTITATSMLTSKKPEPQQSDSNELAQIRQNTEDTAKHTKKDGFDICGIIISFLAFITAGITLFYAYRTYKSQKQTQKNTTPLFTKDRQYEVLCSIAHTLIDIYIEAGVVKVKIGINDETNKEKKSNFTKIPSEMLFPSQFIDSNELHLELFYENREKVISTSNKTNKNSKITMFDSSDYLLISTLKSMIDGYNNVRKILTQQVLEQNVDYRVLIEEYDASVIRQIPLILKQIQRVTEKSFSDKEDIRNQIVKYVCYRKYNYRNDNLGQRSVTEDDINSYKIHALSKFHMLFPALWFDLYKGFDVPQSFIENGGDVPEVLLAEEYKKTNGYHIFTTNLDMAILGDMKNKYGKTPSINYHQMKK